MNTLDAGSSFPECQWGPKQTCKMLFSAVFFDNFSSSDTATSEASADQWSLQSRLYTARIRLFDPWICHLARFYFRCCWSRRCDFESTYSRHDESIFEASRYKTLDVDRSRRVWISLDDHQSYFKAWKRWLKQLFCLRPRRVWQNGAISSKERPFFTR